MQKCLGGTLVLGREARSGLGSSFRVWRGAGRADPGPGGVRSGPGRGSVGADPGPGGSWEGRSGSVRVLGGQIRVREGLPGAAFGYGMAKTLLGWPASMSAPPGRPRIGQKWPKRAISGQNGSISRDPRAQDRAQEQLFGMGWRRPCSGWPASMSAPPRNPQNLAKRPFSVKKGSISRDPGPESTLQAPPGAAFRYGRPRVCLRSIAA